MRLSIISCAASPGFSPRARLAGRRSRHPRNRAHRRRLVPRSSSSEHRPRARRHLIGYHPGDCPRHPEPLPEPTQTRREQIQQRRQATVRSRITELETKRKRAGSPKRKVIAQLAPAAFEPSEAAQPRTNDQALGQALDGPGTGKAFHFDLSPAAFDTQAPHPAATSQTCTEEKLILLGRPTLAFRWKPLHH